MVLYKIAYIYILIFYGLAFYIFYVLFLLLLFSCFPQNSTPKSIPKPPPTLHPFPDSPLSPAFPRTILDPSTPESLQTLWINSRKSSKTFQLLGIKLSSSKPRFNGTGMENSSVLLQLLEKLHP